MEIVPRLVSVCEFLERIDRDMAESVHLRGCVHCGSRLHRADFDRLPRGGPESLLNRWLKRASFCCEREGCRKRHTPPSVRFLGRRVYVGVYVVLVAAMMHGPNARRVAQLHAALGIDPRTLRRWRDWWLKDFVQSRFWRSVRGRFLLVLDEGRMPYPLVGAFAADGCEGLIRLLKFLRPITTNSCTGVCAM